jgi:hypothetical protein
MYTEHFDIHVWAWRKAKGKWYMPSKLQEVPHMTENGKRALQMYRAKGAQFVLILHINCFTRRLDGGYVLEVATGRATGKYMTTEEIGAHIAANPAMIVDVCHA